MKKVGALVLGCLFFAACGSGKTEEAATPTTTSISPLSTTTTSPYLPPPPVRAPTPYEKALAGARELADTVCNDPTAPAGLCEDELESVAWLEAQGALGDPTVDPEEYEVPDYEYEDYEVPGYEP